MSLAIAYNNLSVAPLDGAVALDFLAASLDSRITFTRASTRRYYGSDGLLATAASNVCPLEYNPTTLAAVGRSFWRAGTNQVLRSQEFDSDSPTMWTRTNITVTPNATTAPDGTTTADLIAATSAAAVVARTANNVMLATGTSYTASIYTKKGTRTTARFLIRNDTSGTNFSACTFNYDTGAVDQSDWSAQQLPNGWWRLSFTRSSGITVGDSLAFYWGELGAVLAAGASWYVWGAQVAVGTPVGPYIATTTATATRSADVASIADLSSIAFNPTRGTFLVQHTAASGAPLVGSSGAAVVASQGTGKIALAYTPSGTRKVHNGGSVTTGSALTFGSSLTIGSDGTSYANAPIARITYWPYNISDAAMQALTA